MQILGINFKSKAEREQDEKKYKERIFPGGEEEREKVCRELAKRLPGKDEKDLLMCYMFPKSLHTIVHYSCFRGTIGGKLPRP